ncbi:MAG: response regulator [Flavobacterium sp.]|nr:MAG: response regulator [Flavobacterium sp.]
MSPDLIIFYADDDPEDLDVFAEIAMVSGIEVIPINDPNELHTALLNAPPGNKMVFLDINMPSKSGFDLMKEIKSSDKLKRLPIVAFSTGHDAVTIKKSWDFGADLFIRKGNSLSQYKEIFQKVKKIDWQNFQRDPKEFVLKIE